MPDKVQEKPKGGILNTLVGTAKNDTEQDAQTVGSALAWALGFGAVFAIAWQPKYWAAACMWAAACALVGMLFGFLFGIPRFLTRPGAVVAQSSNHPPPPVGGGSQPPVQQPVPSANAVGGEGQLPVEQPVPPVNAVGGEGQLPVQQPAPPANTGGEGQPPVQQPAPMGSINTNLEEISDWLTKIIVGVSLVELQKAQTKLLEAAGFIAQTLGGPPQTSFAYGLMIYFSVSGFLGSYLLTRLYLQIAFRNAASRS